MHQPQGRLSQQKSRSQGLPIKYTPVPTNVQEIQLPSSPRFIRQQMESAGQKILHLATAQKQPRQCMEIKMGQANQLAEPPMGFQSQGTEQMTTGQSHSNGMPPNVEGSTMVQQNGQHDAS